MPPKPVFILNGPNLNLLGAREPEIYGRDTLEDVKARCMLKARTLSLSIDFRQTNHEGQLIDWTQEARDAACGLVINAGGYTHSSIALLDALLALPIPCVEVHLSNIYKREAFRRHSYLSAAALGVICGFGPIGYELALDVMADRVSAQAR